MIKGSAFSYITIIFLLYLGIGCSYNPVVPEKLIQTIDNLNIKAYEEVEKNPVNSALLVDSAIQLCSYTDYPKGLSDAYARKGLYFENIGWFDSAYHYHIKSLVIRKTLGDKKLIAFSYTNLGETVQEIKGMKVSKSYLDSAWELFHQVKDTLYLMKINQQVGKYYVDIENYHRAIPYFKTGLNYARQQQDHMQESVFLQSLGNVYGSLENFDSSYFFYELWYELLKKNNDSVDLYEYYCCIANNYIETKKINEATLALKNADEIFSHLKIDSSECLYLLARKYELSEARGNYKSAYQYALEYNAINEKIVSGSAAKNIAGMEVKYKTSEKENLNKILLSENSRKSWIIYALITGTLLLAVSVFFIYRNSRQKQLISKQQLDIKESEINSLLQSKELETFDAALRGQDEERARIARELHDRLGSLLSIAKLNFSSLQNDIQKLEQKNRSNYNQVSSMLEEAADEVRRISHDLYAGSVINFGIVTALYQLADAVSAANKLTVKFQHKNIPSHINQEQQINLYRTVQELLSNTLKYAGAKRIDLQLIGNTDGSISFTYEDDGKGFDVSETMKSAGIGFKNIETRMRKINATYHIDSFPSKGMNFTCEFTPRQTDI